MQERLNSLISKAEYEEIRDKNNVTELVFGHTADIQVNANGVWKTREFEYRFMLREMLIDFLNAGVSVVTVVGDIFERAVTSDNEKDVIVEWLYDILYYDIIVILVPGNHDLRQRNFTYNPGTGEDVTMIDSIEHIFKTINHKNLHYIQRSGFYKIEALSRSVIFANWSHKTLYSTFEEEYNPWLHEKAQDVLNKMSESFVIDLYHNPVRDCIDWDGGVVKGKNETRVSPNEFKGHLAMLGDIHIPFIGINENGRKWSYPSSPVLRDYGEGDYYLNNDLASSRLQRHGYNIVKLSRKEDVEVSITFNPIKQYRALHTIDLKNLSDESFEKFTLQNPGILNAARIRLHFDKSEHSEKLSQLIQRLKSLYTIEIDTFSMVSNNIRASDNEEMHIDSIFDKQLIRNYICEQAQNYIKSSIEDKDFRLATYNEFEKYLAKALDSVEFNSKISNARIKSIDLTNFMSFEKCVLNFEDLEASTITQVHGPNGIGKTKLFTALAWCLTNKYDYRQIANRKDWLISVFNDKLPEEDEASVRIDFTLDNVAYSVIRKLRKVWHNKALKTIDSWKNEVIKVESSLELYQDGVLITDETKVESMMFDFFGNFEQFVETHFINSNTLSSIINMKTEQLIEWLLYQIGATFVNELKLSKHWVKREMFEDVQKPPRDISAIETEKALVQEELTNISKELEDFKSESNKLKDEISTKESSISAIESFKVTQRPERLLQYSTVEEYENHLNTVKTALSNLSAKLTEAQNKKTLAASDNEKVNSAIEGYQLRINENNTRLNDKLENVTKLEKQITTFTNDASEVVNRRIQLVNDSISTLSSEISSINAKQSSTQERIKEILTKTKADRISLMTKALEDKMLTLSKYTEASNTLSISISSERVKNDRILDDIKRFEELCSKPECTECFTPISSNSKVQEKLSLLKEQNIASEELIAKYVNAKAKIQEDIVKTQKEVDDSRTVRDSFSESEVSEEVLMSYASAENKEEFDKLKLENSELLSKESSIKLESSKLREKLESLKELRLEHEDIKPDVKHFLSEIEKLSSEIKSIGSEITQIKAQISTDKEDIDKTKLLIIDVTSINDEIIDTSNKISRLEAVLERSSEDISIIDQYSKDLITQKKNQETINTINEQIKALRTSYDEAHELMLKRQSEVSLTEEKISGFEREIADCKRYYVIDLAFKTYNEILGKDLISYYVFGKLSALLNSDLSDLLTDVNFSVGFDNDTLEFVFVDKSSEIYNTRKISQISGMEETFSALSLLAAVKSRKIKSNTDITMFDEITGKLNDGDGIDVDEQTSKFAKNYQVLFSKLLKAYAQMTNDKVFIVDHILESSVYDNRISIMKDSRGISSITEISK